jgi:hypothetical protein
MRLPVLSTLQPRPACRSSRARGRASIPLRLALLLLALAGLSLGCREAEEPKEQPAVCVLHLPEHLAHIKPDALPARGWFQLLFKGYRDGISEEPVDCSGEPISWTALPDSCTDKEPPANEVLPRKQLTQQDLIIRHAGGEYWFGWAPYRRFDNGMSEGPLAIARVRKGNLEARALGNLRAYTGRARLDVRKLGEHYILVAEGEHCATKESCSRATRLMWLDRQRFRTRPIRSATVRTCLGPAWFPQVEIIERKLSARWSRVLQRSVALAIDETQILVDEHVTVNDRDVEQPSLPPRLFREAQAQLRITIDGGEFLSEGQSLWNAIRTEDGSTEMPAPPAEQL